MSSVNVLDIIAPRHDAVELRHGAWHLEGARAAIGKALNQINEIDSGDVELYIELYSAIVSLRAALKSVCAGEAQIEMSRSVAQQREADQHNNNEEETAA